MNVYSKHPGNDERPALTGAIGVGAVGVGAKRGGRSAGRALRLLLAASAFAFAAACSSPEERVERFSAEGMEYLEAGEIGKANVQFQKALQIDEEHVPSLKGLSRIAEDRQDFKAMFGILQRVIRLDPTQLDARVDLGKIYLLGDDETAALEQAETVLEADGEHDDALALKAAIQLRLGDTAGAVELARRVVERRPDHAEAVTVLVTERAAAGDMESALAELDKALAANENIAVLQLLRIRVLSALDRDEDVISAYRELIDLHPDQPAYRRAYARALIAAEDYAGASAQLETTAELEPNNLNAKIDVIRVVGASMGPDAAEAKLRAYIDAEPDNADLKFALVDFFYNVGRPEDADAVLDGLAENDEQAIALRAKNRIAAKFLREDDRAAAETLVDEILAADERNTDALIKRADLRIEKGDFDNAIIDLRTALDNDPDSTAAMRMMASAFERQNNVNFAQAELAKAFDVSDRDPDIANEFAQFLIRNGNVRRAEDVLVQSLAAHEGDLDNLRLLAGVRLNRQDWRGAEEVAEIIEATEQEADSLDEGLAESVRAAALSGLGDYDRVIETLEARSKTGPLASQPLATLVNAYMRSDRAGEAENLLQRVIASGDNPYAARVLLAQVYGAQLKNDEAEAVLVEATAAEPGRAPAYELLYRYYVRTGQGERATALIDEGLQKAPDNTALKVFKADTLIAAGELEAALDLYEELLQARPDDLIIANNFVSLSSDLRLDEASIAKALEVSRVVERADNPLFKDTVGWAHYRAGDYATAIEHLSEAAEAAPENAEIFYHLGAAQAAAGDTEAARASLQKALDLGGDDFARGEETQTILQGL